MKVKWLTLVCLLMAGVMAGSVAVGCAPAKAPTPKAEVPAGYRALRMVGSSIGSEPSTVVMALAAVFNRYYPEIEWSSCSAEPGPSPVFLTKGSVKLAIAMPGNWVQAYGFDKIPESRVRSITLPRALVHYVFLVPGDAPWTDITQVPKGATICPGTATGTGPVATEMWLNLCGLTKKDFKWVAMGKTEAADAWRAGKLDVYMCSVAGMAPYLMDMYTSGRKFKPMGLTPEQVAKAKREQTFERIGLDPPSMGMLTQLVPEVFKYDVVGPMSLTFLCARDDFPVDIAYKMAKVIDEHHEDLVRIYPAMKFAATPKFHIEWARPPLDIHSGVAKYYREKGYLK